MHPRAPPCRPMFPVEVGKCASQGPPRPAPTPWGSCRPLAPPPGLTPTVPWTAHSHTPAPTSPGLRVSAVLRRGWVAVPSQPLAGPWASPTQVPPLLLSCSWVETGARPVLPAPVGFPGAGARGPTGHSSLSPPGQLWYLCAPPGLPAHRAAPGDLRCSQRSV